MGTGGRDEERRSPELEAAIVEAPESPDAYLVYGDWLLEQGEPLGELVTVQATLAKLRTRAGNLAEKRALERREKLLLRGAEGRLGTLASYEHTWSFGFLESLVVSNPSATAYEALLAAPAARFLRELDIEGMPRVQTRGTTHPTFALLARHGVTPTLRKLALMAGHRLAELGPVPSALWRCLASLRELTIVGGNVEPGHIVLPRLETLRLATPLTDGVLEAVRGDDCPRLASLQLDAQYAGMGAAAAARFGPLFAHWSVAGTLRHLGVTEHDAGDALLERLLTTDLVPQLTSLDLSRTALSDRGASILLENASSFEHLESLNLSANELSGATAAALEKRFDLVVDVDEQGARGDEEDDDDDDD